MNQTAVQDAIDAYNAAVAARQAAEQVQADARTALGIAAAAAEGLHIGDRVTGGRKGEEYEISGFNASLLGGGDVMISVYGRKITKAGVPSKGEPQYIGYLGDRTTIVKVAASEVGA
jgi:cytochrome b involved in lipid metabolism